MMKILGRLSLLIAFCFGLLQAGGITSTVKSREILKGESVILTITVVGENFETLPDIPMVGGAKVLGSNRSMKTRMLIRDGKNIMEQTAILMLEFQPTTSITIPSFQVNIDGELKSTKPIDISIVKKRAKVEQKDDFLMEMNATKDSVVVGEPLVVNIYFKQKENLDVTSIDYKAPLFKSFFSKRIGGENNYKDGDYMVHQLTYLLVAKEEGNISINPATVKVAKRVHNSKNGDWFSATPEWSSAKSVGLNIQAKKLSNSFDAIGVYRLKESIDTQMVKPNKPINLKLIIEGEGSLEDFEGIKFDITGVTVYSDDAKIESKLIRDKLFSRYTKSYAFISDHDFTIPSKQIRVYDYQQKKLRIISSKSYNIVIDSISNNYKAPAVYTKDNMDIISSSRSDISKKIKQNIVWNIPSWLMLFSSFLIGMIVTLLLRPHIHKLKKLKFFKSTKRVPFNEALITLYPHINDSMEVENMVEELYNIQQGKDIKIDRDRLEFLLKYYIDKETILN